MSALLAIDWGTTSLRGALLDERGEVKAERELPRGVMTVEPGTFGTVFQEAFGDWHTYSVLTLVCGMAGSRQGWMEVPYCICPAGFAEISEYLAWVEPNRIAIVPGLIYDRQGAPDVMRGEETQVLGALQLLGLQDALVILPGTHSKWVRVQDGRIRSFVTFMTGEVYALLRQHSILSRSMLHHDGEFDEEAFQRGLWQARVSKSVLQAAFTTRTLALFDRMPLASLPSYLSGVVIGDELRSQDDELPPEVVLVGSHDLSHRYAVALKAWGVRKTRIVGSEATWQGLWALAPVITPDVPT